MRLGLLRLVSGAPCEGRNFAGGCDTRILEQAVVPDESGCWNAVSGRDATADGHFVYAVVTTGVYCCPSCPTPMPLRRNVRFFSDPATAEAAGFCACKRCRPRLASPLAGQIAAVGKACAILHESERAPSLGALADAVGSSRFHFHRMFKRVLGTTPGEYASALRWHRLADSLAAGQPVAEAIYGAGYGSLSRAYEKVRGALGMTPAARRAGGAGTTVRCALVGRGIGYVLVAGTEDGVCAIEFGDDPTQLEQELRRDLPAAALEPCTADLAARVADAVRCAELPPEALALPAAVREVAFRARLRKALGQASDAAHPRNRNARPRVAPPLRRPASTGPAAACLGVG